MFALLKIEEIINSTIIIARFITAIIEPIIVNQFLEEGGSFMVQVSWLNMNRSKNRQLLIDSSTWLKKLNEESIKLSKKSFVNLRVNLSVPWWLKK